MIPQIENWTSNEEALELRRLAADRLVLEVGTYRGFGAVLMASAGATVWAVDWHRGDSGGDPGLGPQDTLCAWWRNVRRHGLEDRVVGLVGRSKDVLPLLRERSFDLAFIDASHRLEGVRLDIALTLPLMRPDGKLVFHDYSPSWPDVMQAVDELGAGRYPVVPIAMGRVGSLAVLHL